MNVRRFDKPLSANKDGRSWLWVVGMALLSLATASDSAADFSPLTLLYRPVDYVAPIYSSQRDAPYLFFSGEPVHFEVFIFNGGNAVSELVTKQRSVQDSFEFAVRLDDKSVHPKLIVEPDVYVEQIGPRLPISWTPRLAISPKQKVVFHWRMAQTDATEGRYRIEVLLQMTDEAGRQVKPQGSIIDFEIRRSSTPQDAAEVILRKGWRAFLASQYDDAEEVANDLLRMNPRSYAAFVLKGQVASARQKPAEKLEMYRAALAIAASNLDPWCTRCAGDLISRPSVVEVLQCLIRGSICE
jgi:tetratricopeptide (TPR) repeat protein